MIPNVFACLPRDTSGLPEVPGVPVPVPSIQHTLKQCQECGQDIWVGPNQLAMYRTEHDVMVCLMCALAWFNTKDPDDVDIVMASLNPDEPTIPRRT